MDNVLFTIVLLRVVVHFSCGVLLLRSWMSSKKHYISDFPFVLALMFLTLFVAKGVDLYIMASFTPASTLVAYFIMLRLRYVIMALNTIEMLVIVLFIWNRSRNKVNIGIIAGYTAAWAIWLFFVNDFFSLSKSVYLVVPVMILMVATFIFTYVQKRLTSKFNSLHVAIGVIVYVVSQLLRPALVTIGGGDWGMSWLCEVIDLAGWMLIFWGFIERSIQLKKRNVEPSMVVE
jgi:hypothetical protein